jgi:hypothetical protein
MTGTDATGAVTSWSITLHAPIVGGVAPITVVWTAYDPNSPANSRTWTDGVDTTHPIDPNPGSESPQGGCWYTISYVATDAAGDTCRAGGPHVNVGQYP